PSWASGTGRSPWTGASRPAWRSRACRTARRRSWRARLSSAPPIRRRQSARCAMPRASRGAPEVVDALAHRGQFFRVLQQTERSQTAVMTIAPGEDGGPPEEHAGDQIVYIVEGEVVLTIGAQEHRAGPGTSRSTRPTR